MLTARIGLEKQRKLPACQVPQIYSRSSLGSMFFFFLIYHHVTFSAILKPFSLLNSEFKVNLLWLISLSWRSGLMFRCGVRRRLRCSLLWVWGFGSVIAYSSYNPRNNNCHRDAFTVSGVNFMTLFWPRWWCLLCWASEPKPSPQSVLNGQYAAQTQGLVNV